MNKASHQRTLMSTEEIKIDRKALITYQRVQQYFQTNYQNIQTKQTFIKVNPIRSLIVNNLLKAIPWWSDFWEKLVIEDFQGYLFNQLFYNREGIIKMTNNSEQDEQYLTFIKVFQQAMKSTFAVIRGFMPLGVAQGNG